jgi:hypothetical protein
MQTKLLFLLFLLLIVRKAEAQQRSDVTCKGNHFSKPAIIEGFLSDTSFNSTLEIIKKDSLKKIKRIVPPYEAIKITGFNYYVEGPGMNCDGHTFFVNGDTFKDDDLASINGLRDKCILVIECVFAINSIGQQLILPPKVYSIRD